MINYYTDYHDVDEDMKTIASQGCRWESVELGGIHDRNLTNPEVFISDNVAYKDKNTTLSSRMVFLMI